jgi:3-phytase
MTNESNQNGVSMKLLNYSLLALSLVFSTVSFATQTHPSYSHLADSAVWVNNNHSLMIATLEDDGIAVYDQQGKEVQHIDVEDAQGADVVYNVSDESGHLVDLAAIALPNSKQIAFYRIGQDRNTPLEEVSRIQTDMSLAGVCLTHNRISGDITAVGYSKKGEVNQYKLAFNSRDVYSILEQQRHAVPVRILQIGGEASACVSDDVNNELYIAEKHVGIWVYGANPESVKQRQLLDVSAPIGHIGKIESMAIFYQAGKTPILLVADKRQGFLLYDLNAHRYLSKFDVKGVAEAKLVSTGKDMIWIGNTELKSPVYQSISYSRLNELAKVNFAPILDPRSLDKSKMKKTLKQK